ncbi:hypothetical protein [Citrobacter sp. CK205]|uniref:hypothetical protein n=1 Tax=Citrobacter sp. CK205 TaxID=2985114 RepID=UPI0025767AF3|nr:hypothetical protein [Citrobacter sp. CK205]MDM3130714.1 hypothetical protein [Citrobacter sp. CK205]
MTIYDCLFEPKKSAIKDGAVALAISIDAPNKKVAESIVIGKLWEHYPANGDNYFKPKLWEHLPGHPSPQAGSFDEEFPKEHSFDGEKWVLNTSPADSNNMLPKDDEIVDLMKVSPRERLAAVLLFSNAQIDGAVYSQVCDYLDNLDNGDANDDEEQDRFNRHVLSAMEAHEPVKHMHVDGLNNLLQAIYANFENQMSGRSAIYQFVKKWTDNISKRDEMLPQKTNDTHQNSAVEASAQRGYKHSYATLDQEIALALLPVPYGETVSVRALRAAERVIEEDREDFKRWSMALRTTEQILKYDRQSIFDVVQNVPAKDTYNSPESLRRHIDSWLASNGHFEDGETAAVSQPVTEQDTASNDGEKTEVTKQEAVTEDQAIQARETLNDMGYGVYATNQDDAGQQEENLSDKVKTLVQDVDQLVERIKREEQLPQASEMVQSINEMQVGEGDNLELWKEVFKTDERFTSAFSVNGGGTSINGTYMTMIATREFGPKGIGWGVDVLEERFDDGAPITRTVKGSDGNNTWELISDGIGGILTEKNHVIKIRLWYVRNGKRGEEIAYGCTPYLYSTKYGPFCDGEATKKSLTDATKKALSALGFCADIFMGLYDNPEYRQKNKAEFALKNASENAEDAARVRQELDDKLTKVANTLASAVSENEINKVYSSIAREAEVHRKDAEEKGDTQHARYLSGRLRRLTDIKNGRIAELNKTGEKA